MRGVNKAIIVGRLGKDPEVRALPSGATVTGFSLAVSEKWKDKNTGQPVEKTEWLNCSAFGKTAEIIAEYVKKGDPLYVEGKIQTDKWTDQNGIDRYSTKIIVNNIEFLGGGNGGQQQHAPQQQYQQPQQHLQQNMNQGLPPQYQGGNPNNYQAPPQGQQQQMPQQGQSDGQFDSDIPF